MTMSDNWAFIPPDVLNGLMDRDSNNRARQRVLRRTAAETQFTCFLCGNHSHWFLVVADLGSCTINIFNSAGTLANQLTIKHLLPLLTCSVYAAFYHVGFPITSGYTGYFPSPGYFLAGLML
jgi:hypothetical protein